MGKLNKDYAYPNAPIQEAVLDIQVTLPEETDFQDLYRVNEQFKDQYPVADELAEASGAITLGKQVGSSISTTKVAHKFQSADGKQVYQSRMDGFRISRLAPYKDWKKFKSEASKIWLAYKECMEPDKINRIALRYINKINIPESKVDLPEYFTSSPHVPDELPQHLAHFITRMLIPFEDTQSVAAITQTVLESTEQKITPIVLDIDVFRSADLDVRNEQELWTFFDQLRDQKNNIFESFITDKTRELFK